MSVIVVTGGSQGIGAAICRLAATRGYKVCFSYSRDAAPAEQLTAEIASEGGQALAVKADAGDETDMVRLFDTAANLGPITALANNAGITGPMAKLENVTSRILDDVLGVNVRGAFLAIREAARRMASGGAIVNISSRASGLGGAGEWVHYGASKGAVDTLTIGAARELAPQGIRVNAVNPGMIDTAIHAKGGDVGRMARSIPTIPLGRIGIAEDVAFAVLWLLSDEAAYITGALLPVSGGR